MRFSALLLTLLLVLQSTYAADSHHNVIGWIEAIKISPAGDHIMAAKIDSGADNSSLHATDIEYFQQQDQTWVRFHTVEGIEYQTPLIQKTSIKMKDGNRQERPVIAAELCIGNQSRQIHLNLVDRGHFKYAALIGRSALQNFLIDPQAKNLAGLPSCIRQDAK